MLTCFEPTAPGERPSLFATVSEDGRLKLWDTAAGALHVQLTRPAHLSSVWTCIAWHRAAGGGGAQLIALGADGGGVVVWDVQRGAAVHELAAHTRRVHHVAFAPAGDVLVTCGDDRQVCSWATGSGELLHTLSAGKAAVHRLALSGDGRQLLLAATAMRLMRRDTWKVTARLGGHATAVQRVAVSADDRLALSCAADRHLSLWDLGGKRDAADGNVATLSLDAQIVELGFAPPPAAAAAAVSAVYSFFAISADGELCVWRVPAAALAPKPAAAKGGKKKGAAAANGAAAADAALASPAHRVRVAPAAEAAGGGSSGAAAADPLRIFAAAFVGQEELLVACGSSVRPTLARVVVGGDAAAEISVRRPPTNLLSAAPDAAGGSAAAGGKRGRDAPPDVLGAAQMKLPSRTIIGASAAAAAAAGGAPAADDADDEAAAPFGARVAARDASLAVAAGGAAAVPAFGVDGGGGGKRRRPSAASQVAMLAQSLQNGDVQMLDEVLQVHDAQTVMNTVARLPVTAVLPFLEAILQRIQGKPSRVAALATWLRALLAQHAAYLMACPNLLELLTPLYQLIDERLQVRHAAPLAAPAFPNARDPLTARPFPHPFRCSSRSSSWSAACRCSSPKSRRRMRAARCSSRRRGRRGSRGR